MMAVRCEDAIHEYFGLTYAAYLCMPRSVLQAMPADWQRRFVALLEEANAGGVKTPDNYHITLRGEDGRFKSDPLCNYRRPDRDVVARCLGGYRPDARKRVSDD